MSEQMFLFEYINLHEMHITCSYIILPEETSRHARKRGNEQEDKANSSVLDAGDETYR